jgi:hypothetical protein
MHGWQHDIANPRQAAPPVPFDKRLSRSASYSPSFPSRPEVRLRHDTFRFHAQSTLHAALRPLSFPSQMTFPVLAECRSGVWYRPQKARRSVSFQISHLPWPLYSQPSKRQTTSDREINGVLYLRLQYVCYRIEVQLHDSTPLFMTCYDPVIHYLHLYPTRSSGELCSHEAGIVASGMMWIAVRTGKVQQSRSLSVGPAQRS